MLVVDLENCCLDVCSRNRIEARARRRAKLREQLEAANARRTTGSRLSNSEPRDVPLHIKLGVPVVDVGSPPSHALYTHGDESVQPSGGHGAIWVADPVAGIPEAPPVDRGQEYWESRVKAMKGQEVVRFAESLGLTFERNAPNPGVLCMRARNTIYNWLKKGNLPNAT